MNKRTFKKQLPNDDVMTYDFIQHSWGVEEIVSRDWNHLLYPKHQVQRVVRHKGALINAVIEVGLKKNNRLDGAKEYYDHANARLAVGEALSLLASAKSLMIKTLETIVNSSDEGCVSYEETIDESCGYTETRVIHDNLEIENEDGYVIGRVDSLSCDKICDILSQVIK